jgi:hypothetical protein
MWGFLKKMLADSRCLAGIMMALFIGAIVLAFWEVLPTNVFF